MNRPLLKPFLSSLCSLALIALPVAASGDKTDISNVVSRILKLLSLLAPGSRCISAQADIRIVGSEDGKLTVDVSGKDKDKIDDLRYRLTSSGGNAELHISGGPRNDINFEVSRPTKLPNSTPASPPATLPSKRHRQ